VKLHKQSLRVKGVGAIESTTNAWKLQYSYITSSLVVFQKESKSRSVVDGEVYKFGKE
jgi:hypothetical protein